MAISVVDYVVSAQLSTSLAGMVTMLKSRVSEEDADKVTVEYIKLRASQLRASAKKNPADKALVEKFPTYLKAGARGRSGDKNMRNAIIQQLVDAEFARLRKEEEAKLAEKKEEEDKIAADKAMAELVGQIESPELALA